MKILKYFISFALITFSCAGWSNNSKEHKHFDETFGSDNADLLLNQKLGASKKGVSKTFEIQSSNVTEQFEFEIKIQNGNGLDYFQKYCSGTRLQIIFCEIQNLKSKIFVKIDRPEQLEIKLNGSIIANRDNFPIEKGIFKTSAFLSGQQMLNLFQKGLPTSSITLTVKKYLKPNQLPIANFTFVTTNDVEPSLVSFSALMSADPDGQITNYDWDFGDNSYGSGALAQHIYNIAGQYNVKLTVTDNRGAKSSVTQAVNIRPDIYGPVISNIRPTSFSEIDQNRIILSGDSDEALSNVSVQIENEDLISAQVNGKQFSVELNFSTHGQKNILITASDLKNNQSVTNISYKITFNNQPIAQIGILSQNSSIVPSMLWFDGTGSSDPDGDQLSYLWDFGDGETSTEPKPTHLFKEAGTQTISLTVKDDYGGVNTITKSISLSNPVVPEDPALIAPPLSKDTLQTNQEKLGFLFEGETAVQKNVDVSQLEEPRMTPIRGQILKDSTTPLEAVKVFVKDHPEYGYTLSREDGAWDLVVNGGDIITVVFEKVGFSSALRQVDTVKLSAKNVDDVILVQVDDKKTVVQMNSSEPQVHEATEVQDRDGVRKAQIVIPENTTAEIVMPDGSKKSIDQITIRATEYTVGPDGPKRMPAPLPPRSGYTYAADFTADEAIADGASSVEFSKPVPIYVDNFLNFQPGSAVPVGYLNPKSGYWEQMPDGIVLKVLSIDEAQKAVLDMHGEGQPITTDELALLSITDSELKVIGQKFQSGQSFWRAQSTHFSVIDLNHNVIGNYVKPLPKNKPDPKDKCGRTIGCILNIPRQLLDEEIALTGLGDYVLRYSTECVPGRKIDSGIRINPFNEFTMNSYQPLISAKVTVSIAGKSFSQDYTNPKLDDLFEFVWDGRDAFGRPLYTSQLAHVSIEYLYPDNYRVNSWQPGTYTFDTLNQGVKIVLDSARAEYKLYNNFDVQISSPLDMYRTKALKQFNGWTLKNYHSYDPIKKTFYMGDGTTMLSEMYTKVVTTIAGDGQARSSGDGGSALNASFYLPTAAARDVRGNVFITEADGFVIRKIDKNGIVSTVAGVGRSGYSGDGGPAVLAEIGSPRGIKVTEDGTIYFNDFTYHVVRKITPDGIISTFAGNGTPGYSGDGGPATEAQLNGPRGLIVSKDGSVYISDSNNNVLRRIWTDGKITTFAGVGTAGFSGDNGPATEAQFNFPNYTDIDDQGNIYVADSRNRRIRMISATGIVTTIAGNGLANGYAPENARATDVSLIQPTVVRVTDKGEVYFSDQFVHKIRKINSEGLISTVIGTGVAGYNGDGLTGPDTLINEVRGFAVEPDGSIIIMDTRNNRMRKLSTSLSTKFPIEMPSPDGAEIYIFNASGLHEKTLFADTKAIKYQFIHDENNFLVEVKDSYERSLIIGRDSDGNLKSMTGPYGQTYAFTSDSNKYLTSVRDPLNNTYSMTYSHDGLMTSFSKPEGNTSTYEFDTLGRLTKAIEPNGGYQQLTLANDSSVEYRTGEGIFKKYKMELVGNVTNYIEVQEDGKSVLMSNNRSTGISVTQSTPADTTVIQKNSSDRRFPGYVSYQSYSSKSYLNYNNARNQQSASRSYIKHADNINFTRTIVNNDSWGSSTQNIFNSALKTINIQTASGVTNSTTINDQLKPIRIQNGQSILPIDMIYDGHGRLIQTTQGDRVTRMSYDQFGHLDQIIDSENRTTKFIKDILGRTISTITPDQELTNVEYDRNSNITGITPPQRLLHRFINNTIDLLASYTAPESATSKTYQYDSDRRIRSIASEDNLQTNYTYGNVDADASNNKLVQLTTPALSFSYQYHSDYKWLQSVSSSDNMQINYNRADDLLLSKNYAGLFFCTISYEYNYAGLLQSSENVNNSIIYQNYNADKELTSNGDLFLERDITMGLITKKAMRNFVELISYNPYGEIASREYQFNSNTFHKEIYTRDKLGRITLKNITQDSNNFNVNYQYDIRGRLSTITNPSTQIVFNYDAQGNRLSSSNNDVQNFTASYDQQDRITEVNSDGKRTTYTYSAGGNQIVKNQVDDQILTTYQINPMNQLRQVEIVSASETKTIRYLTDGENKRSAKIVNGVVQAYYLYDKHLRLIAELSPNQTLKSRFVYGSQGHSPDYMIDYPTGEYLFFVKDHLGSIVKVMNQQGQIKQEIQYNEFGVVLSDTNPGFQPFGFAGGHYDHETGLVRFGARDYDAKLGRWLERDPIMFEGGDTNLYSYVGQDPVNKIDPSGLYWFRQPCQKPGVVGREGTPVPPEGKISEFIEKYVPAGYTFGQMHDSFVDSATSEGVPDLLANIPSMFDIYILAVKTELLRSIGLLDQPSTVNEGK